MSEEKSFKDMRTKLVFARVRDQRLDIPFMGFWATIGEDDRGRFVRIAQQDQTWSDIKKTLKPGNVIECRVNSFHDFERYGAISEVAKDTGEAIEVRVK
jgi:hypothetical protein